MAALWDHFTAQAASCRAMGSAFTARLADLAPRYLDRSTRTGARILDWPETAAADAVSLRLFGGLHRLVLDGEDAALAAAYPPNEVDDEALVAAVRQAIARHDALLHDGLDSPPQTNEVARSALLLPGYLWLVRRFAMPLDIIELGASAGLNLHFDAYRYRYGNETWGASDAPLTLAPDCEVAPPLGGGLIIARRRACDLNPLDPADADHRLHLLSYVWADQTARHDRLAAALDHAAARPDRVERADAAEFIERCLAEPPLPNTLRVVVHTIFWQYLPAPIQARILGAISAAGAQAPLAWLRLEDDGERPGAGLHLTLLPSGEHHLLARGDFHGRWIKWHAGSES